jgi:hypothetical protein
MVPGATIGLASVDLRPQEKWDMVSVWDFAIGRAGAAISSQVFTAFQAAVDKASTIYVGGGKVFLRQVYIASSPRQGQLIRKCWMSNLNGT